MEIDLELYRYSVSVSSDPLVRLSVIDVSPERPQRSILFIHGFGGHARHWVYQLWDLSVKNRVVGIDLRGHGQSDKPAGEYRMDEIQNDLEIAIDKLRISEKFVIAGHSFGGAVATEFTARHPDQINGLILIATPGEFNLNTSRKVGLHLPLPLLRLLDPFTQRWLFAPSYVLQPWYRNTLSKWIGWSMFRDITVPTLVIRGYRDLVFDKPMFEDVARAIPNAEDVDVGASGHMVMLERRDAVNRAMQRFLEPTQRTWRESSVQDDETTPAKLVSARPWLKHYESGVPYTIATPNIPLHSLLRSAVRRFPLHTAINFEGNRITYRRLNHEVNRFANALHSLGVNKGDRLMLLLPNIPQMVICYYGALKASAVPVFSLPNTELRELICQVQVSGSKVIVTIDRYTDLAHQVIQEAKAQNNCPLEHVIFTSSGVYLPTPKRALLWFASRKLPRLWTVSDRSQHDQEPGPSEDINSYTTRKRRTGELPGPSDIGMRRFRRLLYSQSRKSPPVETSPDDLAVIIFTGGTTAAPKGVMLSHHNLVANALQSRHWMPAAKEGRESFLCVIPFSHSYGLTTGLNVPISIGATLVLKAKFEVEDVLKTIKRHRPTIFPGVPQMYIAISRFPGVRKYGISSINACISGSAPLAVEVQEEFEKLTRSRLVEGYGLTEAAPTTHANPLNGLRKVGTIGIPFPSTEAKIVDLASGKNEVPIGQIGELAVRGPQVMMGYWQNPEDTRKVLNKDGWLLTSDVAQMDTDGYFRIVARKADMWYPSKPDDPAFPRDVEEVLHEVPQVKEVAVVAIAGQPIAFITSGKDRPTSEALIAYCKRRLPPELVPRLVIFVNEFPRTFIGKVLRRELAKNFIRRQYKQTHTET